MAAVAAAAEATFAREIDELSSVLFAPALAPVLGHLFERNVSDMFGALLRPEAMTRSTCATLDEQSVGHADFASCFHNLFVPTRSDAATSQQSHPYVCAGFIGENMSNGEMRAIFGSSTIGRIAIHFRTGEALMVQDLEHNPDRCVLGLWKPTSTIGMRHVFAIFNQRQLEDAVNARCKTRMSDAYVMSISRSLLRDCVVCGKPPALLCGCLIPPCEVLVPDNTHIARHACINRGRHFGQFTLSAHPRLHASTMRKEISHFLSRLPTTTPTSSLLWKNHIQHGFSVSTDERCRRRLMQVGFATCLSRAAILQHAPSRLTVEAPPNTTHSCTNPQSQQSTSAHTVTSVSDQRAETLRKRRERNRASAAKANARRKAEDQARKVALADARRRVQQLQHRKRELENENRYLALAIARRSASTQSPA